MIPFKPTTDTAALAVTTTSQSLDLPASGGATKGGDMQVLLTVVGTETVWIAIGEAAVIPSTSNESSFPVIAGTQRIFTLPAGQTLNAIASATGSTLYVTQGLGD